jgi:hypothetical protein
LPLEEQDSFIPFLILAKASVLDLKQLALMQAFAAGGVQAPFVMFQNFGASDLIQQPPPAHSNIYIFKLNPTLPSSMKGDKCHNFKSASDID